MSDFNDDISRGCLSNGEPLEAKYGSGWWSEQQEQEPEFETGVCPLCKGNAWFYGGQFAECETCGKTYEDMEGGQDE